MRPPRTPLVLALAACALAQPASARASPATSTLDDDAAALARAAGGILTGIRPARRLELARLLGGALPGLDGAVRARLERELAAELRARRSGRPWLAPLARERLGASLDAAAHRTAPVDDGLGQALIDVDPLCPAVAERACGRGPGLSLEVEARGGWGRWLEAEVVPRVALADGDPADHATSPVALERALATAALGPLALTVGRAPLGLGPSARTQLVLSRHAPPLDHLRLVLEPWAPRPLARFVTVSGAWYLGRLRAPQTFAGPLITGARLEAAVPLLGATGGVQEAFVAGGDGAPPFTLHDFVENYVRRASGEKGSGSAGFDNREIGFDGALAPPGVAGARLYGELVMEDKRRLGNALRFTTGYLLGLELPRVRLAGRGLELRLEAQHLPPLLYRHGLFHTGWGQRGRSLGSPLGPGADALYVGGRLSTERLVARAWIEAARFVGDDFVQTFEADGITAGDVVVTTPRPDEERLQVGGDLVRRLGPDDLFAAAALELVHDAGFVDGRTRPGVRIVLGYELRFDAPRVEAH